MVQRTCYASKNQILLNLNQIQIKLQLQINWMLNKKLPFNLLQKNYLKEVALKYIEDFKF